jgi:hypothetical protein
MPNDTQPVCARNWQTPSSRGMKMDANERYVRERWEHIKYADTALSVLAGPHYVIIFSEENRRQIFAPYRHTEAEAWAAAKAFTVEREKQIAEVEEEIEYVEFRMRDIEENGGKIYVECAYRTLERIFAREQAALAELKRGMK